MWENTTPSNELPRDFCAGIGPLQLGVVLILINFIHWLEKIFFIILCLQDAGQKKFGATQCSVCGMVYCHADPVDEAAHAKFHKHLLDALKFPVGPV